MGINEEFGKKGEEIRLDEEIEYEGLIKGSQEIKSLDETNKNKMSKCICKISGNRIGTGFFCKIKYKNNLIPALITNYHVVDDNYLKDTNILKIYINDKSKIINLNEKNIIYSSIKEKYDIIIIKLNENDINNYLEIDENIFNINSENTYKNEQIYLLHYPNSGQASISYGNGIEKISEYNIKHLCNTQPGSSGGPILSRLTDKVIGIHKACINKKNDRYNIGTFLKFPLNDLNKENITIKNKEIKIEGPYRNYKTQKKINLKEKSADENNKNENKINENDKKISINYSSHKYSKGNIIIENLNNGLVYIGSYNSRGFKQGFGIQKWPDGSIFRGIYADDKVTGFGIYEHSDGDVYKGQFIDDLANGYGEYSHSNGYDFMEIGSVMCDLVLDMKYGMILFNIQVNIIMEKKKELVHFFGQIKLYIKVNGKMII